MADDLVTTDHQAVLVDILVHHSRVDIGGCSCGWSELGRSWAEHVAHVYKDALTAQQSTDGDEPARLQYSIEWKTKGSEWQHRHFTDEQAAVNYYLLCKEARNLKVVKFRQRTLAPWVTVMEHRPQSD